MTGTCRAGRFCASWLSSQHGRCSVHVSTQMERVSRACGGVEEGTAWGIGFWGWHQLDCLLFLSHVSLWLFFLRRICEAPDQLHVPLSFEISNQPLHWLKSWRRHQANVLYIVLTLQRIILSYDTILWVLKHPAYLHSALHYHAASLLYHFSSR